MSRLLPAALLLLVAAFSRDARPADPDLQTRMATVVYRDMDYRRYACDADDCTFDEFRKHIAFRREILRARPEAAGYFVEPKDQRGNFFTGFFVVRSADPELQNRPVPLPMVQFPRKLNVMPNCWKVFTGWTI